MTWLEHKIPPPLIWVLASALIYAIDRADVDGSPLESTAADLLGFAVGVAGVAVAFLGLRSFSRAGTTVDPHSIDNASTLVISGVYRLTRNPMYLGMALLSIGWALRLGTVVGLIVGPAFLVLALTRLQIQPEERVLAAKFGESYDRYRSDVRRWL